ncbi:MAG: hypothetical protein KF768_09240 [Phycisphaeraceae bacterium]|nr:hypothetical protein [Phycisphaeraceae bacterium]
MPTTCPPPPTPTGACCLAGGACITLTAQNCRVQGGVYQGDGADCAVTPCPGAPRGACCVQIHGSRGNSGATSNCILTDRVRCNIQGGTYVGDNTDCRTANCPPTQPLMGACCTAGQCTVTTAQTCRSASGIYFGDRTVCTTTSCPGAPTGACCQSTSGGAVVPCAIRTRAACVSVGGAYRGDGVACQSVSCIAPHLGACCVPLSGGGHGCVQVRSADCTTLGGSFLGASVACPSVQCPPPCPCDINGDGVVDLADEVAFLTLFNANMADLDNDGDTDQDDAAVFYSCYPQGCP